MSNEKKSTMDIQVTLTLSVSDKLCGHFLTTCVEGGSSYWLACDTVERAEDLTVTKIVGCCDTENPDDPETKWGDADYTTLREGIRRILSGEVAVASNIRGDILAAVLDDDNANWDAETADCVLQAGLLNDITYG